MQFFDISVPISNGIPEWPGATKYIREEIKSSAITSKLQIGSHFGTHVDAPKHFLFTSDPVDKIDVSKLIGKFKVFVLNAKGMIKVKDIQKLLIYPGDRVLFRTKNSDYVENKKFKLNYISLSLEAAKYLAKKKVLLVGTDYYGIEAKGSPGHKVHKTLLSKKIVIAEGLNLKKVPQGTYNGAILPLKIKGGDGAPARAILWK